MALDAQHCKITEDLGHPLNAELERLRLEPRASVDLANAPSGFVGEGTIDRIRG